MRQKANSGDRSLAAGSITPSVRQRSATRDMSELMRLLGNFDDKLGTNLIEELHKAIRRVDSGAFDGSGLPVRRICLKEDVFAAMIGWLVRGGWADGLCERPVLSARIGFILWQLVGRRQFGDRQREIVCASLVTRYLVLLQAFGIDATDRDKVKAVTYDANPTVLPRYWPQPPWICDRSWRQVTRIDCERFLTGYDRFWSDLPWRRQSADISQRDNRDNGRRYFLSHRFELPTGAEIARAQVIKDEIDEGPQTIILSRRKALAHATLASYAAQILPDHRPLSVGLKLLQVRMHVGAVVKPDLRRVASLVLSHLALLHGIPLTDAFEVSLTPEIGGRLGWFDAEQGLLNLQVGNGYYPQLAGRVPPQTLRLPITSVTQMLIKYLIHSGVTSAATLYGADRLDQIMGDLQDLIGESDQSRSRLRRLHQAWQYVALMKARINPAILALLCAEIVGPFRADANYLTTDEQFLFECLGRIHAEVFKYAGIPFSAGDNSPSPKNRVGKCSPNLEEWALSAVRHLADLNRADEITASCNLILAAHGRRWTSDLPHPKANILIYENRPLMILADKNLGGGRRVRFVPMSASGFQIFGAPP